MNRRSGLLLVLVVLVPLVAFSQEYVLVGWNDLGMHCSNKDFSRMAVLPPYNNIVAQIIHKVPGSTPQVVTTGFRVDYSIPGNSYSVGKTNFWTYAQQLFGLAQPLPDNTGLTGKGLTGSLDTTGNHFKAIGIPVTPYQDNNLVQENPYQLIHLVARVIATGDTVATTDVVIPVSNEIGCVQSGCHSSEASIINSHESVSGFNRNQPILCASCHASNALGTVGNPEARPFSYRIHDVHSFITPTNAVSTCYKCHPGPNTQCLRDVMGKNPTNPLACQTCHGTMANVASTVLAGRRPWLDEPQCGNTTCHGSNYAEQSGKLYRESQGHGGLYCSACHGSPHAIQPTVQANDNLQNIRLQGFSGTLRTCTVCHASTPTGAGPHGIMGGTTQTLQVDMISAWNMISVPLAVADSRTTTLFPTAISNAFAYNGSYVRRDTLNHPNGYWLKFGSAQTVNLTGSTRLTDTLTVIAGWNMIGSVSSSTPVASIIQQPAGIVASSYYGFTLAGYGAATSVEPGKSYWVKITAPGKLILTH
jgi:hypothetical protein